ncbi:MAG TPA: methyltransferase [Acidobacteriota bacterium]|nr:methyltransferase [Acidobacteriota bacterium]
MSKQSASEIPLPFQLSRMVSSLWVPRAIYTAAKLKIPEALADGPRSSRQVAKAVEAHPKATHRLLRALTAIGLCRSEGEDTFSLTPMGDCLRAESPRTVRSWALLMGSAMEWELWGKLVDCVRSGDPAPKLVDGSATFDFIAAHPEEAALFDKAMTEMTGHIASAIAQAYDFSGIENIIDLGGGQGSLMAAILKANPAVRGVVLDLAHCREGAERLMKEAGLAERCRFQSGDLFKSVPEGAGAYILKSVIHDWSDPDSLRILGNCRRAMDRGARLLLIEVIVPNQAGTSDLDRAIVGTDLNMLVNTGGQERTESELRDLLGQAGMKVERIIATPSALSIIEAVSSG